MAFNANKGYLVIVRKIRITRIAESGLCDQVDVYNGTFYVGAFLSNHCPGGSVNVTGTEPCYTHESLKYLKWARVLKVACRSVAPSSMLQAFFHFLIFPVLPVPRPALFFQLGDHLVGIGCDF